MLIKNRKISIIIEELNKTLIYQKVLLRYQLIYLSDKNAKKKNKENNEVP